MGQGYNFLQSTLRRMRTFSLAVMGTPMSEIRAAPIARFAGHVVGALGCFVVVALGAVLLGWLIDLLAAVNFSLCSATFTVDPLILRVFYGAKLFILFVDMVLFVAFIGTSGWVVLREILGWAKH
jgi:hypothetical protein